MPKPSAAPRRRRTRASIAAAVIAVGALALSACSAASPETTPETSSGPVEGGVLRVALGSDASIINPHLTGSSVTATITRDVVDSLVAQSEDNSFHPWLAEDWEVSEDNTEYTFHLRDDVTFSDGEPLTAEAVKINFEYILDPANNSTYARSLLGAVSEIEATDEHTVVIRYDEPFAPLLQALSLPYLGIQSPAYVQSGGDLAGDVVGSGPFVLDSWAQGQGSTLSKRDDYAWGSDSFEHTGAAYLDGIEYSYLPEASTRLGALTSGQVDAIDAIPPANYESVTSTDGVVVDTYENPGVVYAFQLNTTRAPFDDVLVRQAFQTGVDIDTAVKATLFDTVEPAQGILGPQTEYVDESIDGSWKNDPEGAEALLDEAGWTETDDDGYRVKDGERLSVAWTYDESTSGEDNVNLVQALQSEYREIGIELVLDPVDSGTATARTTSGDYDLTSYYFVRAEADILRTVYGSASIGTGNSSRVDSLDAQLNEAVGADADRRAELYAEVQQTVIDEAYSVPVYIPAYHLGHSDELQGVRWATNAKPLFYNAWLDSGE